MEFTAMNTDVLMPGKTAKKNVNGADKNFNQNGKNNHVVLSLVSQIITVCKITHTHHTTTSPMVPNCCRAFVFDCPGSCFLRFGNTPIPVIGLCLSHVHFMSM